jgi:hypothetical protein
MRSSPVSPPVVGLYAAMARLGPAIVLGPVVSAVAPMTPLLLFQFSLEELLARHSQRLPGGKGASLPERHSSGRRFLLK